MTFSANGSDECLLVPPTRQCRAWSIKIRRSTKIVLDWLSRRPKRLSCSAWSKLEHSALKIWNWWAWVMEFHFSSWIMKTIFQEMTVVLLLHQNSSREQNHHQLPPSRSFLVPLAFFSADFKHMGVHGRLVIQRPGAPSLLLSSRFIKTVSSPRVSWLLVHVEDDDGAAGAPKCSQE